MTASMTSWTKNLLHVLVLLTFLAHWPLQTAAEDINLQGLPEETYRDLLCYRSNRTHTVQCQGTKSDEEIEQMFDGASDGSPSRKRRATYDYVRDKSNLLSAEDTSALESRIKRHAGYKYTYSCNCPVVDQSTPFELSPDSAAYPAAAIAALLATPVGQCIVLEFDAATSPPVPDSTDLDARTVSFTCPFSELRLWSYTSTRFNGETCWVVQNFGDLILYTTCETSTCQGCSSSDTYKRGTNVCYSNRCVADVQAVTFWAFCPSQGLVRDKILVPTTCNCRKLECDAKVVKKYYTWWGKK